jgi:hypothetical protein
MVIEIASTPYTALPMVLTSMNRYLNDQKLFLD